MTNVIIALLIAISFLYIAGGSNGRLIMTNSLFITPRNSPAFNPIVNSIDLHIVDVHVEKEKDAMECDQERSPSEKSATSQKKLSFKHSPSVQNTKKIKSSGLNKAKDAFNLLLKVAVTTSGPSTNVKSPLTEQRLSRSSNSARVSHMQVIQPKFQIINVDVPKSRLSNGDHHMQIQKSNKRKLGSTPSPGGGH